MTSLPSISSRSARRILLYLVKNRESTGKVLINELSHVLSKARMCQMCNSLSESDLCDICSDTTRDKSKLCIVSNITDIWSIERSFCYRGMYFSLNGLLSAIDGITPGDLSLEKLVYKLKSDTQSMQEGLLDSKDRIKEIIMCFPSTIDGHATMQYIIDDLSQQIPSFGSIFVITLPAKGIPLGGELEYLDDATIHTAFSSRTKL